MSDKDHSPGSESPPEPGQTGQSSQLPVESGAHEETEGAANQPVGQSTEAPAEG
jgi:hypothetical protein